MRVDFSSNSSGAITTAGGNVTLAHTGNVTVGAGITTGGGAFASSGVAFDNTTAGAIITGGGNVTINHTGLVQFDAAINAAGGNATIISDSIVKGTDPSTLTADRQSRGKYLDRRGRSRCPKDRRSHFERGSRQRHRHYASQRGDARHRFFGGGDHHHEHHRQYHAGHSRSRISHRCYRSVHRNNGGRHSQRNGGSFTNISVGAGGAVTLSATAGAGAITGITVATDTRDAHLQSCGWCYRSSECHSRGEPRQGAFLGSIRLAT